MSVAPLPARFDGDVLVPGSPGYDAARTVWNGTVDRRPAYVVRCAGTDDVRTAVRVARDLGLPLGVRGGGHSAAGWAVPDGGLMIDLSRMARVAVDPDGRAAQVQGGAVLGSLDAAAQPYGLATTAGVVSHTGIGGLALGGGVGWLARQLGLTCDNTLGYEVVTAEGEVVRASAEEHPELFWALRGGGGDFAIVTALELALHPAPELYGGRMMWAAAHAPDVLRAFRRITATAPEELTVWMDLLHLPGADPMVALDVTYLGDGTGARDLLAPLDRLPAPISDSRRIMPVTELGGITAEPTAPSPGISRAELLTRLDDDAAGALLADPIAPLLSVQLRHLGGALARYSDSPHGPLTEPYALYLFGVATDPAAVTARQRALAAALPVSGRKPVTFLNPDETVADAFTPAVLTRLRAVKRRHDPDGLVRSNFPVAG